MTLFIDQYWHILDGSISVNCNNSHKIGQDLQLTAKLIRNSVFWTKCQNLILAKCQSLRSWLEEHAILFLNLINSYCFNNLKVSLQHKIRHKLIVSRYDFYIEILMFDL